MNLKETIEALNTIALEQPAVNQVIKSGNIYDLNEDRNVRFGVFCATQQVHQYDFNAGQNTFNFFLYYVDRLKSDESNKIEIQSTGIEVLKNIIRTFIGEYDVDIDAADFTVFTQSFSEMCAGVYTNISVAVDDDGCVEVF